MIFRLLEKRERWLSQGLHRASRCLSVLTNTSVPATPERNKTIMPVFSCPTNDRIAKHVLSKDETVRIDILRALTGIRSLSSAILLDEFDHLQNLRRKLINSRGVFKGIQNAATVKLSLDGQNCKPAFDVLKSLSNQYEDLTHALSCHRNRSTVDFLCNADFGHIIIKFQVAREEDYWNERALADISNLYGKQLRPGGESKPIIFNVIGIDLLGDGSTPYWEDGTFIRDYTLIDQRNPRNKIPSLRLVQYSLGDVDLNHPDLKKNDQLRQWIEFFKSAHEKEAPPLVIDDSVRKAYDMIRVDTLKSQHPDLLEYAEDKFQHLTEHNQAVEEKGIEIGKEIGKEEAMIAIAGNLLKGGMSVADVARNTGLAEDQVLTLVPAG